MKKFGLLGTSALRSAFVIAVAAAAAPAWAQSSPPARAGDDEGVTEAEAPENLGQNEVEIESGQDATSDEAIVVTGSRIRRPNLESSVPITSLGVQELTDSGTLSVGDELNDLPALRSTFSQANSTRFIGTAGLNALDLRGLGTARTLVLVNGRRHVTATPGIFRVDVNTIPTDLIERVDIVTGGNSAIYGSDAVAGVVNFITKRNFEGVRIRGQGGVSDEKDRGSYFVSATAGKNFADNRGNIAGAFEYSKSNQVFERERNAQTGALTGGPAFVTTDDTTGEPAAGDGIFDQTFIRDRVRPNNNSIGGFFASVCPALPSATATPAQRAAILARRALNCTGTFLPAGQGGSEIANNFVFLPGGSLIVNPCEKDFRPISGSNTCIGGLGRTTQEGDQLFPGLTRYAFNLLASYEATEAFKPFFEAKYVRTEAIESGQPTFLGGTLPGTFRLDNPFLSQQARTTLQTALPAGATTFTIRRFNTDFGFRSEVVKRDTFRIVGGVEGGFNDDWRYEVSFNFGHTDIDFVSKNSTLIANFNKASDARLVNGQVVCGINADTNPANDDPKCVPLNLFGSGAPSQAALDYINFDASSVSEAEQIGALAFLSGDLSQLFELPGGPIGFAVGAEYRSETASSVFDPISSDPANLTFFNVFAPFRPPELQVKEAFGEVRIPLLRDLPFAQELTVEASGRVSDYNQGSTGTVFAYNVSGIYAPIRDIRFRAGYAKSVRAPTLSDLFSTQTQTFINSLVDPCSQTQINSNPNRAKNCAAAGVPTTLVNPANGQVIPFTNAAASGVRAANRGNPDLREEVSKSLTAGFVAQPRFLPGFSLSVDYYDIKINDVIFTLLGQTVINQCYNDPGGIDNPFCAVVTRRTTGPFVGTFAGQTTQVIAGVTYEIPGSETGFATFGQPFNYAKLETSGIDMEVAYRTRIMGDTVLNLRGFLSWVDKKNSFSVVTDPNFADRLLTEIGDPEWEASFKANLDFGEFKIGYDLRWIDKATIGNYEDQFSFQGRPPENADFTEEVFYPDVFYHDLRFEFKPTEQFKFYTGVDNVMDRLPPLGLLGTGGGSGIYNTLGRYFYAGAEIKF